MLKAALLLSKALLICYSAGLACQQPANSSARLPAQTPAEPAAPKAAVTAALPPVPPVPKAAAEIFSAARPLYDFGSAEMKPWHMKVSYQIFEAEGYPAEHGTYEYWWAAPDLYRSTWKRGSVEDTEWRVGEETFHQGSAQALNFYEWKLRSVMLDPLPKPEELDPKVTRLERRDRPFGSVKMPCVMVEPKMPGSGESTSNLPIGMFPTYCFEPQRVMLRAYLAYGGTSVLYQQLVRVQGRLLPKELTISEGANRLVTAGLDGVNGIAADAPELKPEEGATKSKAAGAITLDQGALEGLLVKKVPPVYPQAATAARDQGRVQLAVLIGKDGLIHEIKVLQAPAPSLVGAAMECVRQWQWKPFMLQGEPVEVETKVYIVFKLRQ